MGSEMCIRDRVGRRERALLEREEVDRLEEGVRLALPAARGGAHAGPSEVHGKDLGWFEDRYTGVSVRRAVARPFAWVAQVVDHIARVLPYKASD